ncbi:MAG: histidine phosphatase family protein [Christensenellales bacterium]
MVYFARHGDKIQGGHYNEALDILDEPLSEKGLADAQRIAAYFKNIPLEKIIVSQYQRTQQTAAPTAADKNLPVCVDSRVNEINGGMLKHLKDEEIASVYPDLWKKFTCHLCDVRFPGGESGMDVKRRQDSFLDDLKQEKGNILVVTHDGFIRLLLCNLLGLKVYKRYKFKTNMGGISAIEYDPAGDEWFIARFNQPL